MKQNTFRYSLNLKGKKEQCPQCHKRSYVMFLDLLDNSFLPEKYGRCDREDRCGYFISPYHDGFARDNINPDFKYTQSVEEVKETSYIPISSVVRTLNVKDDNNLVSYLESRLEGFKIVFNNYYVGTLGNWCIFWQIDINGKCRSGKYIKYTPTGNRDKSSITTWEHSRKKLGQQVYPDFNLRQCFFGEHLLKGNNLPVAIVESEKTAIIASKYYPKYIWLACGSKNGLSDYKCEVLKDRNVMLYPDLGAYSVWHEKAVKFGFGISDLIEKEATQEDRDNGLDLADFLLR